MITRTVRHAAHSTLQRAAALGLAAVATLSLLASVDSLATAPAPDSLMAAGLAAHVAQIKTAART